MHGDRRRRDPLVSTSQNDQHVPRRWLTASDCRLDDFIGTVEQQTKLADYPFAATVDRGVVTYDSNELAQVTHDPARRQAIQAELISALLDGPGIVVFKAAFETDIINRATAAFERMIRDQRASGVTAGDHFAKPGANDRVWNALEKLAVRDPEIFVDYYANDVVALVSAAWLGPGYQVTSQVNVVNPGGAAQSPHCDYHLGFQSDVVSAEYPAHAHRLSAVLTLQGAVAHVDMPVESGPTLYLPHSQKFDPVYLSWRNADVASYFDTHHVQLPLSKGDAVFFNPALLHAAGHNRTVDIKRMANLLQVSSAFGRAMESIDRGRMVKSLFGVLLSRQAEGMSERRLANVIAASAEGYPFPTNLDRDQPVDGLAPPSQAAITALALRQRLSVTDLNAQLDSALTRQLSSVEMRDARS